MTALGPEAFSDYFHALHGYKPFRWQQRLADLVSSESWPRALALPTASGKTACIDIAVFAMACQADWPSEKRTAPRRIFFVVDRRIIVNEAHTRAVMIAEQLKHSSCGLLGDVADRLRSLAGNCDAKPLVCGELRGAVYRDNTWAKSPTQPTIICSTVDQIGSRLLFRGYGLGHGTRVVHAGLVANDALIILDEAHCAKPFYQTGMAIRRYREWCDPSRRPSTPFHFVVMSATPPAEIPSDTIFPTRQVWETDLAQCDQQLLRNRIDVLKPAKLVEAPKETVKSNAKLVATLVQQALSMTSNQHLRIGIISNRVATAKQVYESLRSKDHDAVLLTGRMRGIDREELLKTWKPRANSAIQSVSVALEDEINREDNCGAAACGLLKWFGIKSDRPVLDHPVFVVATQCLEVGANLDFDAIVTECASFDALRQRFGRLNRAGREIELAEAFQSRAAIVIRGDQIESKDDDPVYGSSLKNTWRWLSENQKNDFVEFGVGSIEKMLPSPGSERTELLEMLQMPTNNAPVMLPSHIDCWAQTSPVPMPDPDPAIFLHGPAEGRPEVQVCWRADLFASENNSLDEERAAVWIDVLSLCPPSAAECLSVPLYQMRKWILGQAESAGSMSDIETASGFGIDEDEQIATVFPILIWRGTEDSEYLKSVDDVRPGDTLIFPVALGRNFARSKEEPQDVWNQFGHVPLDTVIDRGDETNFATRGKAVLRLHPALINDWPESGAKTALIDLMQSDELLEQASNFQHILNSFNAEQVPFRLRSLVRAIASRRPKLYVHPSCRPLNKEQTSSFGVILVSPNWFSPKLELNGVNELHETFVNDDDSSSISREVELNKHLQDVSVLAQRFAEGCGLAIPMVQDFIIAAKCHDLGKLDMRFQAWLRGGNVLQARLAPKYLAKSEGQTSRSSREQARIHSGYPKGGRHELVSVRLLEQGEVVLNKASDPDLVLHLIASHHGYCRPFAPVVVDEVPLTVTGQIDDLQVATSSATALERLDSGVADRFWRLVRRYGWWGLAWLEAIFVLADHRCSEDEQRNAELNEIVAKK